MSSTITLKFTDDASKDLSLTAFSRYPNCVFVTACDACKETVSFSTVFSSLEWEIIEEVLERKRSETDLPLELWSKAAIYGLVTPEIAFVRNVKRNEEKQLEDFLTSENGLLLVERKDYDRYLPVLSTLPGVAPFFAVVKDFKSRGGKSKRELKAVVIEKGVLLYYRGSNKDLPGYEKRSLELLKAINDERFDANKLKYEILKARDPIREDYENERDYESMKWGYDRCSNKFKARVEETVVIENDSNEDSRVQMRKFDLTIRKPFTIKSYDAVRPILNIYETKDNTNDRWFFGEKVFADDSFTTCETLADISLCIDQNRHRHPCFHAKYEDFASVLPENFVTLPYNPLDLVDRIKNSKEVIDKWVDESHCSTSVIGQDYHQHRCGSRVESYTLVCGFVKL